MNIIKDKISVIMAVYNCETTLKESIDSILAQTYENWQFVICDDCSTDGTLAIVKEYQSKYPEKFVVIQNEVNSKLAFSLNHCLEHANGEFIARMDGDDFCDPTRFEKQIAFLKSHPDIQLVSTAMQRFSDAGKGMVDKKPSYPDKYTLRRDVPFNHATIMTYKSVYDALGGYTVAKRTERGQDYDLWFRFFAAGYKGANMEEPLYWVREDENAIKRRTFKVRWSVFQTTRFGFKLLRFPKHWILMEGVKVFFKSLVPTKVVLMYRNWQSKNK